ncbi:MAG: hypothetical protein ACOX9B_06460 [Candidatus Xenobium sp.]|jgi:hypothetical protein|nr:hypothetical protein [Burkholderiales bacterium]
MNMPAEDSRQAVRFLTALLVTQPGVGAAQLIQGDQQEGPLLSLEFFLHNRLGTARFREFSREVREAHQVFAMLKGLDGPVLKVLRAGTPRPSASFESSEEVPDRVHSVLVQRDLRTMAVEDLSLLVEVVEEELERDLVRGEDYEEDDDGYHEEVLATSLERIRFLPHKTDLVGYRDGLRVLVYDLRQDGGD